MDYFVIFAVRTAVALRFALVGWRSQILDFADFGLHGRTAALEKI